MEGRSLVHYDSSEMIGAPLAVDRPGIKYASTEPKNPTSASESHNSFGARVRRFEEELVLDAALEASTADFQSKFGYDQLVQQQALSEGIRQTIPATQKLAKASDDNRKYLTSLILRQGDLHDTFAASVNRARGDGIPTNPRSEKMKDSSRT
jgi:hypothetical protein